MSANGGDAKYKECKEGNKKAIALTTADKNARESVSNKSEKTIINAEDELHDGCIVLRENSDKGVRYCTRFHIDRSKQRKLLSISEIVIKACCPCFQRGKQLSGGSRLWQIFRSQAFLLMLHLTVVVLGVLKECLNLPEVSKEAHFWHSVVETFIAILIIIIRHVSAWHAFKQLKIQRNEVEYVDPKLGVKTRSTALKRLLKCYTAFAIFLILLAIICFILFYSLAHLGWTILSNNFALVMIMASDALLRGGMAAEGSLMREDHSKAVTYEMSLLLNEAVNAPQGLARERVNQRIRKFQEAFRETTMFNQPEYINVPDNFKAQDDQLNMLTTMEVISA